MNKRKKRELLIHCTQVVGGLLLIVPFFNETSWLRFVALAGFLLVIYNFIWFVKNSEEILYEIFPTKNIREKNAKFGDKIWQHISSGLFGGGLIFLILQMGNIENIIEESRFWKKYAIIGFIAGIISLFLIRLVRASVFMESGRRYAVIFGFVLGSMFISASSACYFNSKYADSSVAKVEFPVKRKSSGGTKSKAYWIFIEIDNSTRRFKLSRILWNQLQEGDTVLLEIRKGFLGYDYIQKIELINKYEKSTKDLV